MSKTYKPSRVASWVIFNSAYAICLWLGVSGSSGAANVVVFFTWLVAAGTLGILISGGLKPGGRSVPRAVANVTESVMLAALVWHGWLWTASAYLAVAVMEAAIYDMDD